jgi:hypothetical protein
MDNGSMDDDPRNKDWNLLGNVVIRCERCGSVFFAEVAVNALFFIRARTVTPAGWSSQRSMGGAYVSASTRENGAGRMLGIAARRG